MKKIKYIVIVIYFFILSIFLVGCEYDISMNMDTHDCESVENNPYSDEFMPWENKRLEKYIKLISQDLYDFNLSEVEELTIGSTQIIINDKVLDLSLSYNQNEINYIAGFSDLNHFPNLKKVSIEFSASSNIWEIPILDNCKNIENLEIKNANIEDISNIDKYTKLKTLKIEDSYIQDFSPIFKLENLQTLSLDNAGPINRVDGKLDNNYIAFDCRNLCKLYDLEEVTLGNFTLSNIKELKNLKLLKSLELKNILTNEEIYSIAENDYISKLTLDIYHMDDANHKQAIKIDFDKFENPESISQLKIYNEFKNIDKLKNVENLCVFSPNIYVENRDEISRLKKLKHIEFSHSNLDELNFLKDKSSLESLELNNCDFLMDSLYSLFDKSSKIASLKITSDEINEKNGNNRNYQWKSVDFSKFIDKSHLKKLDVECEFQNLRDFEILEEVTLKNNYIKNNIDFSNIKKLSKLYLENVIVDNPSVFSKLNSLESLTILAYSYEKDDDLLTYFSANKNLNELSILPSKSEYFNLEAKGNVRKIDVLANFPELRKLDFRNNQVENIEKLANLSNLTYLDIRNNPIKNFSPINDLKNSCTVIMDEKDIDYDIYKNHEIAFDKKLNLSIDIPSCMFKCESCNDKVSFSFYDSRYCTYSNIRIYNLGDSYKLNDKIDACVFPSWMNKSSSDLIIKGEKIKLDSGINVVIYRNMYGDSKLYFQNNDEIILLKIHIDIQIKNTDDIFSHIINSIQVENSTDKVETDVDDSEIELPLVENNIPEELENYFAKADITYYFAANNSERIMPVSASVLNNPVTVCIPLPSYIKVEDLPASLSDLSYQYFDAETDEFYFISISGLYNSNEHDTLRMKNGNSFKTHSGETGVYKMIDDEMVEAEIHIDNYYMHFLIRMKNTKNLFPYILENIIVYKDKCEKN